jgi:hypothetical protein
MVNVTGLASFIGVAAGLGVGRRVRVGSGVVATLSVGVGDAGGVALGVTSAPDDRVPGVAGTGTVESGRDMDVHPAVSRTVSIASAADLHALQRTVLLPALLRMNLLALQL